MFHNKLHNIWGKPHCLVFWMENFNVYQYSDAAHMKAGTDALYAILWHGNLNNKKSVKGQGNLHFGRHWVKVLVPSSCVFMKGSFRKDFFLKIPHFAYINLWNRKQEVWQLMQVFCGREKSKFYSSFTFKLSVYWSAALFGSIPEVSWKQGLYLKIMRRKPHRPMRKHTAWKFIK